MKTIEADWYEYPQYYDLAFRSETKAEADFVEAACRKYLPFRAQRILEPACGSGRLVRALAARGYQVLGFDQSEAALRYLRTRLSRCGLQAEVFSADMTSFCLQQPVDVVLNTFNTFRHLTTERDARAHLQCVAQALRPGGIFVLGMHLLPPDVDDESCERWTARHGSLKVTCTLRVLDTNHRRRLETLRLIMRIESPKRLFRIRSEFALRRYNATQFKRLLASVPQLELCDVYDFWYEIDHPLKLDDHITDTVFILRKRGGNPCGFAKRTSS